MHLLRTIWHTASSLLSTCEQIESEPPTSNNAVDQLNLELDGAVPLVSRHQDAHVTRNGAVPKQLFKNGGLHFNDVPDRNIRRRLERAPTINGDVTLP